MRTIICTGMLAVAMIFTACNKQQGEADKEPNDINKNTMDEAKQANESNDAVKEKCSDFVVEADQHGKMDYEMAKIANERASSKEVKVLALQMMGDHAKANAELESIAQKKNIKLATEANKGDAADADRLGKEKGEAFDKMYLDLTVMHHKRTVKMFEEAAEDCEDAEIKSFASSKLPVLKKHLDMAEVMHEGMKKKSNESYTSEPGKEGPH